jgi:hypothetical protein
MNVLSPWLLSALILVLAVGVFLFLRRPRLTKKTESGSISQPLFEEETAQELEPHFPAVPIRSAHNFHEPQLPHNYGIDRIVLMARDPHWLYAYWEVTATKQEAFKKSYGPAAWTSTRPVLRVYDVTGVDFTGINAQSYLDIHVNEQTDNWHIQVGEPDHTFCVDLGRMFPDGRFVTLLRSNTVTTPRASLSDRLDEEWMWIEGLYRSLNKFQYGTSSPMIIEEFAIGEGKLPLGISSPEFNRPEDKINQNQ